MPSASSSVLPTKRTIWPKAKKNNQITIRREEWLSETERSFNSQSFREGQLNSIHSRWWCGRMDFWANSVTRTINSRTESMLSTLNNKHAKLLRYSLFLINTAWPLPSIHSPVHTLTINGHSYKGYRSLSIMSMAENATTAINDRISAQYPSIRAFLIPLHDE